MNKRLQKILLFSVAICFTFLLPLLSSANVSANSTTLKNRTERILNYQTKIIVNEDSSLDVTENIAVVALNQNINHGIFRDFPTKYHDQFGIKENVGFEVLDIYKSTDEFTYVKEPYFTEGLSNGTRVYIGSENVTLNPGVYYYKIHYKTTYQLNNFADTDELYYNITGNYWQFPIDKASAEIILPKNFDSKKIDLKSYQGSVGSTEESKSYTISSTNKNTIINIKSTRSFGVGEGLTVKINFPKGSINYPFDHDGWIRKVKDNLDYIILPFSLVLGLIYYLFAWQRYGIDPRKKAIIPRFEAPKDFSPAAVGVLYNKAYSNKLFTAAIVSLGVKGYLKIVEKEEGILIFKTTSYTLEKVKDSDDSLSVEEQLIMEKLLKNQDSYNIKSSYSPKFAGLISDFTSQVLKDYLDTNYKFNYIITGIGILVTAGAFVVAAVLSGNLESYIAPAIVGVVVFIFFSILFSVIFNGRSTLKLIGGIVGIVGISLITLLITFATSILVFWPMLYVIISGVLAGLFFALIQKPTEEGQRKIEEIEGFKMYLEAAEVPDLEIINREHPKTLDVFQKYLPFAIALGVETKWTSQFEDQINKAQLDGSNDTFLWYAGSSTFFNSSSMSSFTSSIGSTISSASTAPSSSGSGGGGSSGGGGGGGGGGGW